MCDKVVWDKVVCVSEQTGGGGGGGGGGAGWYRIKNKNPTQRCGENCEQMVGWTKSAFAGDLLIEILFAIDIFRIFAFPQNVIRILSRLVAGWLGNSCPGL